MVSVAFFGCFYTRDNTEGPGEISFLPSSTFWLSLLVAAYAAWGCGCPEKRSMTRRVVLVSLAQQAIELDLSVVSAYC